MKEIKLIAFDIDGTLIKRGSQQIPQDVKDAIKELQNKGIIIVVATGRSSYFIQDDVIETIQPDFYVTVNGHLVVDKNMEPVYKNPISLEETHLLINEAKRLGFSIGLKTQNYIDVYHQFDYFAPRYLSNDMSKLHILRNFEDKELPTEAPYGAFMMGNEEDIFTLDTKLERCVLTYAYKNAYEVFDRDAGKSDGLEFVLNKYGLKWDEVMTFGDAHNDVPMLSKASISIAMGDGHEDAKKAATYITGSVDENGIVNALKRYKLID